MNLYVEVIKAAERERQARVADAAAGRTRRRVAFLASTAISEDGRVPGSHLDDLVDLLDRRA